jgi:hypothetical protein
MVVVKMDSITYKEGNKEEKTFRNKRLVWYHQ